MLLKDFYHSTVNKNEHYIMVLLAKLLMITLINHIVKLELVMEHM